MCFFVNNNKSCKINIDLHSCASNIITSVVSPIKILPQTCIINMLKFFEINHTILLKKDKLKCQNIQSKLCPKL